jgi:hypothetical protein
VPPVVPSSLESGSLLPDSTSFPDADLAEVVGSWSSLPEAIRTAITTLVKVGRQPRSTNERRGPGE